MLPCSISLCREMPPVLSDLEKQEGVCAKEYLYNLVHDESCFHKFVSFEVVTSPVTVLMPGMLWYLNASKGSVIV